jgi:hypothetical protein
MFKPRVQTSFFIALITWQNAACVHKNVDASETLQIQDSSNAKQTYFYLDLITRVKWHKIKCREICIDDAINIICVDN